MRTSQIVTTFIRFAFHIIFKLAILAGSSVYVSAAIKESGIGMDFCLYVWVRVRVRVG